MQTCVTLIRAGALVGGLLVPGPVRAPIPLDPPVTTPLVRPVASLDAVAHPLHSPPVFATRALLGVPITTADGAQLGQLDDVLIDPTEGRITMVIVAAGGRFGFGKARMPHRAGQHVRVAGSQSCGRGPRCCVQ